MQAFLILSDGTAFKGRSFGAQVPKSGELVFNTGMVGYPESLTDPSYRGQILTITYPLVGNYGVPPFTKDNLGLLKHFESNKIQVYICANNQEDLLIVCHLTGPVQLFKVTGLIVSDYTPEYSHWNAKWSLGDWLKSEGVPALEGIDTRAVTKKIRSGENFHIFTRE